MPVKNIVKSFDIPAHYHVYNRASGERQLFRDNTDREYFLYLVKRHLLPSLDESEPLYPTYDVEVVAYCLMGSHFHFLLYQEVDRHEITRFMRSVSTAYSMYYNKKYKSMGHVFQSAFRASRINNEAYLAHISRYIHLNPRSYKTWKWSSYGNYIGVRDDEWVHPQRGKVEGMGMRQYIEFVGEYAETDRRKQHAAIKDLLAF